LPQVAGTDEASDKLKYRNTGSTRGLEQYHSAFVDPMAALGVGCGCAAVGKSTQTRAEPVSDLFVDSWGSGVPVVLVRGSLAIGADLAERIGVSRMVVEGAGHEVQFTGRPLNEALRALWGTASSGSASLSS
jgi:hypothetical protein